MRQPPYATPSVPACDGSGTNDVGANVKDGPSRATAPLSIAACAVAVCR